MIFTILVAVSLQAQAKIPHLDLDLSGAELQKIYDARKKTVRIDLDVNSKEDGAQQEQKRRLDQPVKAGQRNLEWLQFINQNRKDKISFSNPANQRGIPMDAPKEYNEAIAYQQYLDVVAQMPASMKKVIIDGAAFTQDPGVPDDEYALWGDKVDRAYQIAIRWMMLEPYLSSMAGQRYRDVRGYYFIENDPNRDLKLDSLHTLPTAERNQFREWLISVCLNARKAESACDSESRAAIQARTAKAFYNDHKPSAVRNWRSFFNIPKSFPAVDWDKGSPNTASVPFLDPGNQTMRSFLKDNLEAEWKWDLWQLKVKFNSNAPGAIEVIWQPGITPHVPGLGSNQIYMDSNAPLTEWDVQWTIRHEFGHNLGFPDCYLEYYDQTKGVIVSYQMDVSDLMCSRRGKLKQRHYDEMKRIYLR